MRWHGVRLLQSHTETAIAFKKTRTQSSRLWGLRVRDLVGFETYVPNSYSKLQCVVPLLDRRRAGQSHENGQSKCQDARPTTSEHLVSAKTANVWGLND